MYEIQCYALSEHLPQTCKYLHAIFKSASPVSHAEYLLGRYFASHTIDLPSRIVTKCLRYAICNQAVLSAVLRNPASPPAEAGAELPRRLFRALEPRKRDETSWHDYDSPLPFLRWLYSPASGIPPLNTNAHDGYSLTRAVFAGHVPLVRFLLAEGAQPSCKGAMAVLVAIRRKDLSMVRILVERDYASPSDSQGIKRSRLERTEVPKDGSRPNTKKRKLGDRVDVTKDMLKVAVKCDAKDIVDYLATEKGCVPDMATLRLLRR
jgi:hypothetical protein